MPRLIAFAAAAVLALSCSSQAPIEPPPSEAAALGEQIEINGEMYRRQAAKAATTKQNQTALISILIPVETAADGTLIISDTVVIGDRIYTADCAGAPSPATQADDVGNTRDTATDLTVPVPTSSSEGSFWHSPTYHLGPGDVDYFRLRVTVRSDVAIVSGPDGNTLDTYGTLMTSSGRVIHQNDNGEGFEPNFFVWAIGASPGVMYLEVRGATPTTTGSYGLLVGTWLSGAGKQSVGISRERQLAEAFRK